VKLKLDENLTTRLARILTQEDGSLEAPAQ